MLPEHFQTAGAEKRETVGGALSVCSNSIEPRLLHWSCIYGLQPAWHSNQALYAFGWPEIGKPQVKLACHRSSYTWVGLDRSVKCIFNDLAILHCWEEQHGLQFCLDEWRPACACGTVSEIDSWSGYIFQTEITRIPGMRSNHRQLGGAPRCPWATLFRTCCRQPTECMRKVRS